MITNYADVAFEYFAWIKLAEEKNLFLTPEAYEGLVKGREYDMVEVDYVNFLFQECPKTHKRNKVYEPQTLFKTLIHKITPTMVVTSNLDEVISNCDKCDHVKLENEIVTSYGLKCPDLGWDFYCCGESKFLMTGNGDSFSRWMLWENLKQMPNLYYKKN